MNKPLFCLWILLSFTSHVSSQIEPTTCKDPAHIADLESQARASLLNFRSAKETNNYDLKYHRLEWTVDPGERYISGTVTSYFVPTAAGFQSMYFDLSDFLEVSVVRYRGQALTFSQNGSNLLAIESPTVLPMGRLDSLSVTYAGVPPRNGFGSFSTKTHGPAKTPVLWTLSEPYGARDWWPCKQDLNDKVDSIDILVSTPAQYRVASNGLLVSERTNDNQKTYHWRHRHPIPAYLIAIGVTNYAVYSDYVPLENGDAIEVLNYVYPEREAEIRQATKNTVAIMQFFNERFGLYPFADEKYGHAQFGFGGGMEHQTMSFMGGWSFSLQAHELAHQWFGDKITCGSWRDIWLNEGFATYLDGLTIESGLANDDWGLRLSGYFYRWAAGNSAWEVIWW